jgi:hypothetical protein
MHLGPFGYTLACGPYPWPGSGGTNTSGYDLSWGESVYRPLAVRLLLIAGLVMPTTALLSASPASAAGGISCSISHVTAVSPGLEQPPAGDPADTKQTFKVSATLSGCTGSPGITGGTGTGTLKAISPAMPTCADLAKPGSTAGNTGGARTQVKWNNNHTSSVTLAVTVDAPQHGKLSGSVTAGQFKGKAVSGASSFNISQGNCSDAMPVKQLTGSGTITLS